MDSLKETVHEVLAGYTGEGWNSISYLTHNKDSSIFTITDFARINGDHFVGVSVIVRISNEMIIVERDQNDKIVKDALVQAGVPREKIILAYAGEPIPEAIY